MKRYIECISEQEKEKLHNSLEYENGGIIPNYQNPPIPDGYEYVSGSWKEGIVIERCSDKSQFVWVPVGFLDPNGTLDGILFNEKFGRRNYRKDKFSEDGYHEEVTKELKEQINSVKKYDGFYFSRYLISLNKISRKPQSVKESPWQNMEFSRAMEIANSMENSDSVKSHLILGSEYDSILEWFIKSKVRTKEQIIKNSSNWGNYWGTENLKKEVFTKNICDFVGNLDIWTQENYGDIYRVLRGGPSCMTGELSPAAFRKPGYLKNGPFYTGMRVSLYIN